MRSKSSLENYLAICCLLAWRIQWLIYINRSEAAIHINCIFTDLEQKILQLSMKNHLKTAKDFIIALSKLGGYLNRNSDFPPGEKVISRGLARLTNMVQGAMLVMNH